MRYWYGHTGRDLLLGNGRAIRQIVSDTQALQRLLQTADQQYSLYAATPHKRGATVNSKTFTAAVLAPLAVQEFGTSSPQATPFSSAGQVLGLFRGLDIEQVAVNLYNGRIASAYAGSDAAAVATHVVQGFNDGDLLTLPRDEIRLHTPTVLGAIPGAVVFLLSNSHAERKAFDGYLRRGKPPVVPAEAVKAIAKSRPIMRTWEREARIAGGEHRHG